MTELSEQQIAKIGIDTGVNTGLAVWQDNELKAVESMTITQAMSKIKACCPPQMTKFNSDGSAFKHEYGDINLRGVK